MEMDLENQDLGMQNGTNVNSGSSPLVAVFMVTYNHEAFIERAVRSVMAQETTFPYLLVIGEDCSTDNTRAICQKLKAEFPSKIQLLLHEKNIGGLANAKETYDACIASGADYWAFCEGDDFWTSTKKLQMQIDQMEKNLSWGLCFHGAEIQYLNGTKPNEVLSKGTEPAVFSILDLAHINFIPTASLVLRKSAFPGWPSWRGEVLAGDYLITTLTARNNAIGYLPQIMAVYQVHDGGL
jgi:glycosyltransferase involved in cell wall biosynthesis